MAITPDQVKPGVRVRVLKDKATNAVKPDGSGDYVQAGDIIELNGKISEFSDLPMYDVIDSFGNIRHHQVISFDQVDFVDGPESGSDPKSDPKSESSPDPSPATNDDGVSAARLVKGHHLAIAIPVLAARIDDQAREIAELRKQIAEMVPRLLPEGRPVPKEETWPSGTVVRNPDRI
jgi:hypothetical protein